MRYQASKEGIVNAIKLLEASIAIDSTYAPAWADLSVNYINALAIYRLAFNGEGIIKGKQAANKAIALNPEFAKGYVRLAAYERSDWNFKEASQLNTKALKLEPNNIEVIRGASKNAFINGEFNLAIELTQKLIELDPLNNCGKYNLGLYFLMHGQFSIQRKR